MKKQKSTKAATFAPHIRALHKRRVIWFIVLALGLFFIQSAHNIHNGQPQVMGYSTSIASESLLIETNHHRASNQLGELKLSEALQQAAQKKAEDMAARDYWDHKTPEGSEPWALLRDAGYGYAAAGENLAYGFSASSEVLGAWMQSETHKANVLGSYREVGFGVVHTEQYQGGENTIVVALYAEPGASAPDIAAAATQVSDLPAGVSGFAVVTTGNANWATYASLALVGAAAVGFIVTHLELLKHGWYRSRHFMAVHPVFDIFVIVAITFLLVYTAGGFIG